MLDVVHYSYQLSGCVGLLRDETLLFSELNSIKVTHVYDNMGKFKPGEAIGK